MYIIIILFFSVKYIIIFIYLLELWLRIFILFYFIECNLI